MSLNIIELTKQAFTPEIISKFSSSLNESDEAVHKGLNAAIPTLFLGLLGKSQTGIAPLLGSAKELIGGSTTFSDFLSGGSEGILGKAGDFIKQLFGEKLSGIGSVISEYAGLKPASAVSLLEKAAPASLFTLQKTATAGPEGILELLREQKDNIVNALPQGLNLQSLGLGSLGLGSLAAATTPKTTTAIPHVETPHTDSTVPGPKKWNVWKGIVLPIAILAILYFLIARGCSDKKKAAEETPADTTAITTNNIDNSVKESIKVILPNGQQLDAYKGGIEDKLVNFLKSDYKKLGLDSLKNVWFDFDNLNFETASAKITAESQKQIDNIAAILKSFPSVKIKVGGYTDKTGDETINLKLSAARASAVKEALSKAGVGTQVTDAEGYGSKFAKYPSTADESDRVKDRRVSVSVRQ